MYRCLFMLFLGALQVFTPVNGQDNPPPYIYYYANALNAFVVERADGSDSRLVGQGIMPAQQADLVVGAGWSPDGRWLAWSAVSVADYNSVRWGAYAVHVGGVERLALLDAFSYAKMTWSPDGQWLLAAGNLRTCAAYSCPVTYWLINMQTRTAAVQMEIQPAARGAGSTPVEWTPESVSFYEIEDAEGMPHYRITMDFTGGVTRAEITPETYDSLLSYKSDMRPDRLDSPSGRYSAPAFSDTLTDTQTDGHIPLPVHSMSAAGAPPMEARWHPSEDWVLLGSNWRETESRQVGYVTVMGLSRQLHREVSACGFDPTCINWLPEQVEIDELPPAAAQSMLPAPIRYDEDVAFDVGAGKDERYALVCDETATYINRVLDTVTSEIVFALDYEGRCPNADYLQPFPFARSANGHFYATNVGYGMQGHTAVYDAATLQPLIILPTAGWNLAFIEDDLYLVTRAKNARMVWDIAALIASLE